MAFDSALDLARSIRRGELSPSEALDACLAEVDRLDPALGAVIWRDDEGAREEARRAESADDAPFRGVPIPIKDLTPVEGWPVTYGSRGAPDAASGESELVVEALRRAGFVLCGRTNTPEFGPITATENVRYGPTRNPWDPERSPGGSSGGAGAACAAGMFPAAHASDGGGSIRIPASCCGLVGLKPSRGRVPSRHWGWEGGSTDGAVTRDVADTAAILDAISVPDPLGWWAAPAPERPFSEDVGADPGKLRVGVAATAPLGLPLDPACSDAARRAGELLDEAGHAVEPVEVDTLPEDLIGAFLPIVRAGLGDYEDVDWSKVEPHNAEARRLAGEVHSLDYRAAVRTAQRRSREIVAAWGRDFDLLLTPTTAIEPPPVGAVLEAAHAAPGEPAVPVLQMVAFTALANITGLPAINLPVHVADSGLPIGAQLIAPAWQDGLLIRVASEVEDAAGWRERRPQLHRLAAAS